MIYYLGSLFALSVIGAIITVSDKRRAIKRKRRIKESTLWLVSLLGGALGVFCAMLAIRHKTNHLSFMIFLPFLIVFQLILPLLI